MPFYMPSVKKPGSSTKKKRLITVVSRKAERIQEQAVIK